MNVELALKVSNKQGIHARPSSMIVKISMGFHCDVSIKNVDSGFEANAKSPLEVMMLNAPCGTSLVIIAVGDDAQLAVDAIAELITSGFNED